MAGSSATGPDPALTPGPRRKRAVGRRRFLTYLVAAPTLTIAARIGVDAARPEVARAATPSPPQPADIRDLGEILILAGAPTAALLITLRVEQDGTVGVSLPRAEVGQGITTTVAMLVAEEMDVPLSRVRVTLADARPELVFNQLTGGSNSTRSVYDPVRATAAAARAGLVAAAARKWNLPAGRLSVADGTVTAPDGRRATYGSLAALAAATDLSKVTATPKPASEFTLVGTPTSRIDARAMVTGRQRYTLDLDVPGAKPVMVRRPPTINGTVESVRNAAAVRAMSGVIDVVVIPTGVAVLAETFGQALAGVEALDVSWGPGTVDDESNDTITAKLRKATAPFVVPKLLTQHLDAEFDWAPASHAPLEPNTAIADVRSDRAEIWSPLKSPIVAQETIAKELGLPVDKVTVHVVQSGGSFGRRLFFDAALEAAQISGKMGRPVKLMWHRVDDIRHGRAHPAAHHAIRATLALGDVLSFEHRVASVETDWRHGLGEILTATSADLPVAGELGFSETVFETTVKCPYNFGVVTQLLTEVPLKMHTGAFRSVYSYNTRGVEEIMVDRIAKKLGKDPVAFRRSHLKTARQRAVLAKVAEAGAWGRNMPKGWAQGVGVHDEYQSCTACLVEIDGTDPKAPRVTKAVIAVDVGRPINPRGLQSQMLGGLTDAISLVLRAGLHVKDGLPLEGSYSQFHYARQQHAPLDVEVHVMPANGDPGGAGELGLPAAVGAVANAYERATGITVRSFPINFPVDFDPVPPGEYPRPALQ